MTEEKIRRCSNCIMLYGLLAKNIDTIGERLMRRAAMGGVVGELHTVADHLRFANCIDDETSLKLKSVSSKVYSLAAGGVIDKAFEHFDELSDLKYKIARKIAETCTR